MALQWEPKWHRLYVEALLETEQGKLVRRVATAEKAMLLRVEELCTSSDEAVEGQSIEDAITGMAVLKRGMLNPPIGTKTDLGPTIETLGARAN